jgi:hypothetical protein
MHERTITALEEQRARNREDELVSALADALSGYRFWSNNAGAFGTTTARELEVARSDIHRL